AEAYISRLIEKGYKVAICEQVEDPREAKGIVKRDVVRILSPGTVNEGKFLKGEKNNYIMSVYYDMVGFGLSYLDVSTGEFYVTEVRSDTERTKLMEEISKVRPSEMIVNTMLYEQKDLHLQVKRQGNVYVNVLKNKYFDHQKAVGKMTDVFQVFSLQALGLEKKERAVKACGALLEYLDETQKRELTHLDKIHWYHSDEFVSMDHATRSNLELVQTIRGGEKKGSLLHILDRTLTAMGSRKLKQWIDEPLTNAEEITKRLDAVESVVNSVSLQNELKELLSKIYDLKRLLGKLSFGNGTPKDLMDLQTSIALIPSLKQVLGKNKGQMWKDLDKSLDPLEDVSALIEESISSNAPASLKEGNIIKTGYHQEIDEYREISENSREKILAMEKSEKEKTGIRSLKVKYNKVFGYYIEVTKSNLSLVPEEYIRKQTLANCERYFTNELKALEEKIVEADSRLSVLEYEVFMQIRSRVLESVERIKESAEVISIVDVLYSYARCATENQYVKPTVDDSSRVVIFEGRHPVVESMIEKNAFVPNSCELDDQQQRMMILTGPNMAGKSTYIRQVALIVLMAQIGSFVPAQKAHVGTVDRIFTRVGASDDLASGQSTFMVEMSEVSNILKNATAKSLVILDEIG
ncbi:MAG TPA: DNA mismatch repair protein MutS, partial [Eubacteriaceae bacterium]|nr:DNA mismatch repair protein MutS [Eubacteriaceae bacterium]